VLRAGIFGTPEDCGIIDLPASCSAGGTGGISRKTRPADDFLIASLEVAKTCTAVEGCETAMVQKAGQAGGTL
jgi:hypothetical protein